jgi:hypothetical protein
MRFKNSTRPCESVRFTLRTLVILEIAAASPVMTVEVVTTPVVEDGVVDATSSVLVAVVLLVFIKPVVVLVAAVELAVSSAMASDGVLDVWSVVVEAMGVVDVVSA